MDTQNGRQMLTGSDASALVAAIQPFDEVGCLGLNCAFGPYELTETIRYICQNWPRLVSILPNAGLPIYVNNKAHFPMAPPDFTKGVMRFVEEFGVNIVGGCCGTTVEHMKLLCEAVGFRPPVKREVSVKPQVSSLYERGGYPAGQQLSDRRRANEHQRQPAIQTASAGRQLGRPGEHGPGRNPRRLAHAGRVRRFRRTRRRARHAAGDLALRQRPAGTADARQHQRRGDGSGPETGRWTLRSQFHEPRGR